MDYGKLFSKAWDIIWKNKFLILLGVLIALSGGGSNGGNPSLFTFSGDETDWQNFPGFDFEYGNPFQNLDLPLIAIGGIVVLVLVLLLVSLVFWALGTISRGGLIGAVNEIEQGNSTNFSNAFQAGWQKGWRLIGIGLVPAIPGVVLAVLAIISVVMLGGIDVFTQGEFHPAVGVGAFLPLIVLSCIMLPVMLILSLLRVFANRACMLEDLDVIGSYRRGFEVLGDNLGPAALLFLLQIAISFGLGIMMLVPGILIALCCLLWPVFLLVEGGFTAYYSTLWTLAWNEWTGILPVEIKEEKTSSKK
ncbi:MAG: hypothetical protein MUO54_10350 [Anaerolineales bacterium]|nr:hypothetical protein [Anaerolineales bacterium]